jgi:hypothetical protein
MGDSLREVSLTDRLSQRQLRGISPSRVAVAQHVLFEDSHSYMYESEQDEDEVKKWIQRYLKYKSADAIRPQSCKRSKVCLGLSSSHAPLKVQCINDMFLFLGFQVVIMGW